MNSVEQRSKIRESLTKAVKIEGQKAPFALSGRGHEPRVETIRAGCAEGLSAEALIDRLVGVVQDFAGYEPQGDDMTCVVLRVEG